MEERQKTLRDMRICRFCLTEKEPLSNIYQRVKNSIPLTVQIMACVALEVFSNDGMPQLICDNCRLQTNKSYLFKSTCKQSDDALKLYLATGVLKKIKDEQKDAEEGVERATQSAAEDCQQAPPKKRQKCNNDAKNEESENALLKSEVEVMDVAGGEEVSLADVGEVIAEIGTEEAASTPVLEKKSKKVPQVETRCFSCEKCERSFPLQQLLDIHMRQHTRERKFHCLECDKRFFTKHDLAKHSETHSGMKPFSCVVCHKTFARATLLHRHEKVHVSVPKYLCTYCDRTYLALADLDAHMATHKKKRPFKCGKCDKSFAFKQGLERHEAVHNEVNPHKCNYCSESFTTPSKLARHVTSHAGARPYPCKLCTRTFLLSHHLSRHLRNHYSRRPLSTHDGTFKCDVCSMSFGDNRSLVEHSAIHSMVNLRCVICSREFVDVAAVKAHVSSHLDGLEFQCDRCDYSFDALDELEQHEARHDNDPDADADDDADDDDDGDGCDAEEDEDEEVEAEEDDGEDAVVEDGVAAEGDRAVGDEESRRPAAAPSQPPRRRSTRERKVRTLPDFLKDDLDDSESPSDRDDEDATATRPAPGSIQPVVRSEAIRTYRSNRNRPSGPDAPAAEPAAATAATTTAATTTTTTTATPAHMTTKITTLDSLGLSKGAIDALTEKSGPGYVEMKIGQKVVRVQKLMMNKSDVQAIAQDGKIELKGSTIVVKSPVADLTRLAQLAKARDATTEAPVFNVTPALKHHNPPLRTYVKKQTAGASAAAAAATDTATATADPVPEPAPSAADVSIDLAEADNADDHTADDEILASF